jgi:hypothetical protein
MRQSDRTGASSSDLRKGTYKSDFPTEPRQLTRPHIPSSTMHPKAHQSTA